MQPMAGTSKAASYLITTRDGDRTHDPLNSEQFWRRKVDDVRDDEVFFHTYFEKAGKAKQADKKAKKKDRRKNDDSDDESGEDEIWQALVKSRPDVEGDGGDDDDLSDFDMDDMMSDDEPGGMDAGVELNLGSDDDDVDAHSPPPQPDADDMDDFANFDLDDEDGVVDSDAEIPVDFNMDDDTDDENKARKNKKRKLKSLPTFASADAYAKLLAADDDDDTE
jgi:ribosome biogenesis protein MAK21